MTTGMQYGTHLYHICAKNVIHNEGKPMQERSAQCPVNESPGRGHRKDQLESAVKFALECRA